MLYAIVAVLVIIADQAVKYLSLLYIGTKDAIVALIPKVLSLVYVENTGAAFSLLAGSNARIFFIILTGVFTLAVIIALATNFISGRFGRWCMVIVTAGGLSNCIDRVIYGYVQDMFKVELFNFAVFNLADVFITVFCLLFVLYILFGGEKDRVEEDYDEFDEEDSEAADKSPLFGKDVRKQAADAKAARKRAKRRDYDDDEDDYIPPKRTAERSAAPTNRRAAPVSSRPAQSAGAARAAAPVSSRPAQSAGAPQPQRIQRSTAVPGTASTVKAPTPAPAYDPSDPFAEWEKASARVEAQQAGYAAQTMGVKPTVTARPAAVPATPTVPVQPAPAPAQPVPTPVQPAAAPTKPAAKTSSSSEFSLDDILNEFK